MKHKRAHFRYGKNYALGIYAAEKREPRFAENDYGVLARREIQKELDRLSAKIQRMLRNEHI